MFVASETAPLIAPAIDSAQTPLENASYDVCVTCFAIRIAARLDFEHRLDDDHAVERQRRNVHTGPHVPPALAEDVDQQVRTAVHRGGLVRAVRRRVHVADGSRNVNKCVGR